MLNFLSENNIIMMLQNKKTFPNNNHYKFGLTRVWILKMSMFFRNIILNNLKGKYSQTQTIICTTLNTFVLFINLMLINLKHNIKT